MNEATIEALHQWLDAQRTYWENLADNNKQQPDDWQQIMKACRQLFDPSSPPRNAELAESMALQARGFSRYGERLLKAINNSDETVGLEEAVLDFCVHLQDQVDAAALKQWQLPEQLRQFLTSIGVNTSALPGFPFLHESLTARHKHFNERLSDAESLLTAFRNALADYNEIQQRINKDSAHGMLSALKEGKGGESLADLHALWTEQYEIHYQKALQSELYQQTYGQLCNASLRIKSMSQQYWQQEYRELGLVPAKDYSQLLERHHQLTGKLNKSRQQIAKLEQICEQHQARLDRLEQRLDDPLPQPTASTAPTKES